MTENNSIGFFKKKKSLEEIVMTLAVSGINVENKCMFISDDKTANIVKSLLKKYKISFSYFLFWENVLRYSNNFNVLKVFLKLQSEALNKQILERLRDPEVFMQFYNYDKTMSKIGFRKLLDFGFNYFIDSFDNSIFSPTSTKTIATNFLDLLTEGNYESSDIYTTMHFNLMIQADIEALRNRIKKKLEILSLK
jgi:hypothetical protein